MTGQDPPSALPSNISGGVVAVYTVCLRPSNVSGASVASASLPKEFSCRFWTPTIGMFTVWATGENIALGLTLTPLEGTKAGLVNYE